MMNMVSVAAAGFSIIALMLLLLQKRTESKTTKVLANVLLCVLIGIQLMQVFYLSGALEFKSFTAFFYLMSLGLVGPLFYLYSIHIIQIDKMWSINEGWHFAPVLLFAVRGAVLQDQFIISYILMFLLGGIYMGFLARSLYRLRVRRSLFRLEFLLTASFIFWALLVVVVGIFSAQIFELLIPVQIIMLALASAVAIHIQLNYPHILSSLVEFASREYQASTLLNVDCEDIKQKLEELMLVKKVYEDSDLSLSSMAEMLSMKPYQLTELLNTQLGLSFSSYLRNYRIKASEELLKKDEGVSVLAIGLRVGFNSQSAFYSAFKEVHSVAPGQYRRKQKT